MRHIPEILLWLYIINLGIALGAGLYETKIVLPQWFIKLPKIGFKLNSNVMNEMDTGRNFWGMATTIPLTLLTIANLIIAFQSNGVRHNWLLVSSLIILTERLGTFTFFIPTAIKLMRAETITQPKITSMISVWVKMNHIRNAFILLGWLAALRVLSLPV